MEDTALIGFALLVVALFLSGYAVYVWRRRKLIKETPTSKCGQVSQGVVEVEGRARPDGHTLQSPLSDAECVAFQYKVEEKRRRRRRSRSSNRSRSKNRTRWKTIEKGKKCVPFKVVDNTGEVKVNGYQAQIKLHNDKYDGGTLGNDRSIDTGGIMDAMTGSSRGTGRRRYTEKYIAVDDLAYVFGYATGTGDDIEITDGDTPMFLVSDTMADQLVSKKTTAIALCVAGALILYAVGGYLAVTGI